VRPMTPSALPAMSPPAPDVRLGVSLAGRWLLVFCKETLFSHPLYQRELTRRRRLWRQQHLALGAIVVALGFILRGFSASLWAGYLSVWAAAVAGLFLVDLEPLFRLAALRRDGLLADLILTDYSPTETLAAFLRAHLIGRRALAALAVGIVPLIFIPALWGWPYTLFTFVGVMIFLPIAVITLRDLGADRASPVVRMQVDGIFLALHMVEAHIRVAVSTLAGIGIGLVVWVLDEDSHAALPLLAVWAGFLIGTAPARLSLSGLVVLGVLNDRIRAFAFREPWIPPGSR